MLEKARQEAFTLYDCGEIISEVLDALLLCMLLASITPIFSPRTSCFAIER